MNWTRYWPSPPDDHDVLYMLTHSLTDPTTETAQVSEEERLKFEQEFKQYQVNI